MDNLAALTLANKITKALLPELYGKPGLNLQQTATLMGTREIVFQTLLKEPDTTAPQEG